MTDDTLWLTPEMAGYALSNPKRRDVLDTLLEDDAKATISRLASGVEGVDDDTVQTHVDVLFEADIVDVESTGLHEKTVMLTHETIRVMPIVLDGDQPTRRDVLAESLDEDIAPGCVSGDG